LAGHLINKIRKELDLPPVKLPAMSQKAKSDAQKSLQQQVANQLAHLKEGGRPKTIVEKLEQSISQKLQPQG